jgi:hypothetical protein
MTPGQRRNPFRRDADNRASNQTAVHNGAARML